MSTGNSQTTRQAGHGPDQVSIGFPLGLQPHKQQDLAAVETLLSQLDHADHFIIQGFPLGYPLQI